MRLLADENVRPAHVVALRSGGHDVVRVGEVLEKGVTDDAVLSAGRGRDRVILTDDRRDFATATDHVGVLVAVETMPPRPLCEAVDRIERLHPSLDDVVEYLADWT